MVWAARQGQRGEKKEAEAECVGVVVPALKLQIQGLHVK